MEVDIKADDINMEKQTQDVEDLDIHKYDASKSIPEEDDALLDRTEKVLDQRLFLFCTENSPIQEKTVLLLRTPTHINGNTVKV